MGFQPRFQVLHVMQGTTALQGWAKHQSAHFSFRTGKVVPECQTYTAARTMGFAILFQNIKPNNVCFGSCVSLSKGRDN